LAGRLRQSGSSEQTQATLQGGTAFLIRRCGMNCHRLYQRLLYLLIRLSEKTKKALRDHFNQLYPAHTCVDHPTLECPACMKWTGDAFASARSHSQCFAVSRNESSDVVQYQPSGYAIMIRVKLVDRWAWMTWMRYETYEQAAAHLRQREKIVSFGSKEWLNLLSFEADPPSPDSCLSTEQQPQPEQLFG
jgi:hypothetical protein